MSTIDGHGRHSGAVGRVDRMPSDPLPPSWPPEPALAAVGSFGELVSRLRRLDHRSDEALRALARLADAGEPEACLVVTAALLPLLIVRCDRRPELLAEAVPELAARMVEPAARNGRRCREPSAAPGGVAGPSRLRRTVRWQVPDVGPRAAGGRRRPRPAGSRTAAVDRVALEEFRRRLAAAPKGREAWRLMVRTASPTVALSSTERSRLAHAPPGAAPPRRGDPGRLNRRGDVVVVIARPIVFDENSPDRCTGISIGGRPSI